MSSDRSEPLRVAVIGGGVSGLSAAWLLSKTCDVTLYEAEPRLGGHCDTFDWDGAPVDCGFIVYNERTYPKLIALFAELARDIGKLRMQAREAVRLVVERNHDGKPGFHAPSYIPLERRIELVARIGRPSPFAVLSGPHEPAGTA